MKSKFLKFAFLGAVVTAMPMLSQAQMQPMAADELAAVAGQGYLVNVGSMVQFQLPSAADNNPKLAFLNPVRATGLAVLNGKVLGPVNAAVATIPGVGSLITPISVVYVPVP